jgi:transposase
MGHKWRRRFLTDRLDGLRDEPRSGAPRTVDDARIEAVIVRRLESLPVDATHWSSRGMAKASGLSTSTVQRIWRAFGLQPHRAETFKLSTDPDVVAKVRDIVGLSMTPPARALVLCVDETSRIQALDRTRLATSIDIKLSPSVLAGGAMLYKLGRPVHPRERGDGVSLEGAEAAPTKASARISSRRRTTAEVRVQRSMGR